MIIKSNTAFTHTFITEAVKELFAENIRIQRLIDYYNGKQDILQRTLTDPYKPNNKIIANYCRNIADFIAGYLVGDPIDYKNAPEVITENLNYNDGDEQTLQAVTDMNIAGYGVELHYIDSRTIPRFTILPPTECIVVFDDTLEQNIRGFIRVLPYEGKNYKRYDITVYTDQTITTYSLNESVSTLTQTGKPTPHFYKDVPVVFYPNGKELQGSFEQVIPLQNALNKLMSDEINDFEAFVDSYLVLKGMSNTNEADIAKMKENRVLLLDGDGVGAEWLTKNVNNEHIKQLKSDIERQIKAIGRIPDTKDPNFSVTSGIALKMKMIDTEMLVAPQERVVQKAIQRRLELMYNVFKALDPSIGEYTDIEVTIPRSEVIRLASVEYSELIAKGMGWEYGA